MLPWSNAVPSSVEGPRLVGDGFALTAVKPAEDGTALVLRCANVTQRRITGEWRLPFRISSAKRVRLDERSGEGLPIADSGRTVSFVAEAREIVTISVESAEVGVRGAD